MRITIDNLENAIIFTLIFQHIKSFTDFVNLSFQEEKLYIQAMDSSKISVFEVNLMKSFFSTYDFDENEVIGVNVNLLFKILNIRDKKQKLELNVENGDKLNIEFTSDDVSIMNKTLQISLVEIEEDVFGIPDMDYTNMKEYEKKEDDVEVSYTLKLLSYATLYSKITDEVSINITDGVPLKITYILENSNSNLNLYLAPKIND